MIIEHDKLVVDAAAIGTLVATLASWLPSVSTLFTVIWIGIRIWETDTVQKVFRRK